MHITAVSFANFSGTNKVNNSLKSNAQASATPQNATPTRELPGYNVSFGTRIIQYDKNPGVMLSLEQRKQLDDETQEMIKCEGTTGTEIEEQMQQMFEKYHNDKAAMQYILVRGINKMATGDKNVNKYEPYPGYIKAYLHTVNTYFKDSPDERSDYLRKALFTKNLDGNTLAHAVLKPTSDRNNDVLKAIFDETDNYPAIQFEILQDKRNIKIGGNACTETIGERVARCGFTQREDGKMINDVLQKLCANTEEINRQKSIDLLKANERMLNRQNKEILEALQSKDCVCTDNKFKKPGAKKPQPKPAPQGTNKGEAKANNTGNAQGQGKTKEIQVPAFLSADYSGKTNADTSKTASTNKVKVAGAERKAPGQGEMIIPDFLKNYGKKNNKTGKKQEKNDAATQNGAEPVIDMRIKPGDTDPKDWGKELKVGDFFKQSKGSAIQSTFTIPLAQEAEDFEAEYEEPGEFEEFGEAETYEDAETTGATEKIRNFEETAAQRRTEASINWGLTASDG